MMPILVVGVGRSGTSTVARILHENVGYFMGERFAPPTEKNPQGYWEDLSFKEWNSALITGKMDFLKWSMKIETTIRNRDEAYGKMWGLKDPRLCYLLGFYLSLIDSPIIIRCTRNSGKVISSMIKAYRWSAEEAQTVYFDRVKRLDNLLNGMNSYTIDFTEEREDKEVEEWLQKSLCQ